jgi:hypothetical protein
VALDGLRDVLDLGDVDGLVGAQFLGLLEFVRGGVDGDDVRPEGVGDVDRREADAAAAVDGDPVAGRDVDAVDQPVERRGEAAAEPGDVDRVDVFGELDDVVVGVADGELLGEGAGWKETNPSGTTRSQMFARPCLQYRQVPSLRLNGMQTRSPTPSASGSGRSTSSTSILSPTSSKTTARIVSDSCSGSAVLTTREHSRSIRLRFATVLQRATVGRYRRYSGNDRPPREEVNVTATGRFRSLGPAGGAAGSWRRAAEPSADGLHST